MSKIAKRIPGLILAAAMLLSIAACGGSAASSDNSTVSDSKAGSSEALVQKESVTLSLWHIWAADSESSKAPFEKVLADFQTANPDIKLKVDATENETYKTKIRAAVAANEAPDIFFYWSGGYMKSFVDAGKLLPLNDYLDDETRSRQLTGTLSNMTFDGKIYGLAHSMSVGTFFINKELFAQNNVKIPETYEDLTAAVKAFRGKGITPMAVGAKDTWCIDMYLDILETRQAGYDACYKALTKTGSFEEPDIIEGARKLQELIDMGAFTDGAQGVTRDESEVPFYEGKIPMYFNGSWTIGNIMRPDSKIKDKIQIIKFPKLSDKSDINDFTGGVSEIFVVNANTKFKDESVKAIKYISENFAKEVYLAGAGLPTWKVSVDESKIDPLTKELVKLTQDSKTYTLWWNTLLEGDDSQLYMNKSAELFAKRITPEQFVKDLQTMNTKK
ncbi:extracellular solute-binding protein [Ruminiclostridium cellobioparum]|uniref:ABC-type sugar transport system, periplasmic component n=1 Tax=Ruminiclostridium cellobioparum subsp. termitidis CT1112 TaxID=1195236 RepID=S0FWI2_RUMCE|nr:extracellular solute-binding protein [Ruminiclostridium cellobioparum]EMS72898.1 ABC-type sugar transport system, periplasmic component [Ruminiclostridium cellobioparum subsp. termitidis CT1112]